MADSELGDVPKKVEYLQDPNNHYNHHNRIQDALDLALHGNETIHQP
jgi:hypothetical protein